MIMKTPRRTKRPTIFTEIESILRNMIHRRAAEGIEEGGATPQPIWTWRLYDILSGVAGGKKDEERNEDMKTLLNMVSKNGVVIFVDLEKERL